MSVHWETDPVLTVPFLRAGTTLACQPSMLARVKKEKHGREIAENVVENLRDHYGRVIGSEICDWQESKEREDYTDIRGCLSEMAILGTIWWGIANRKRFSPDTYMLPATKERDLAYIYDGRRRGIDFILGNARGVQNHIQVKSDKELDDGLPYTDDTLIIEPRDLRRPPRGVPYSAFVTSCALIDALANDDGRKLAPAVVKASDIIFEFSSRTRLVA